MTFKFGNFYFKNNDLYPVDKLIEKVLYDPKNGYYSKKFPFGSNGDFITAPTISNLFSEIIAIWVVSAWEKLGKPKVFNFVELGPGDGSLAKVLLETFMKFPEFNRSKKFYLYEKSNKLKNFQKNKLKNFDIEWIKNFNNINNGPVIFFGNEFFDALPIKQFLVKDGEILEKFFSVDKRHGLKEFYKKTNSRDIKKIRSFNSLKNRDFIEFPKLGFKELNRMIKKISKISGGILLIDYGYFNLKNKNTLQAIINNKKIKMSNLHKNLGSADITYLVDFKLLKEFFLKKKFKLKKIVNQKFFLERMGIINRARILEKKMNKKQKKYMIDTLERLLDKKKMGDLFKVIFAFKSNTEDFIGFN